MDLSNKQRILLTLLILLMSIKIFYQVVLFFSPLIISTLLCALAFLSLGRLLEESHPSSIQTQPQGKPVYWRPAHLHESPREVIYNEKHTPVCNGSISEVVIQELPVNPPMIIEIKDRDKQDDLSSDSSSVTCESESQASNAKESLDETSNLKMGYSKAEESTSSGEDESSGDEKSTDYESPRLSRFSEDHEFNKYMRLFIEEPQEVEYTRTYTVPHLQQGYVRRTVRRRHFLSDLLFLPALFKLSKRCFFACFRPRRF